MSRPRASAANWIHIVGWESFGGRVQRGTLVSDFHFHPWRTRSTKQSCDWSAKQRKIDRQIPCHFSDVKRFVASASERKLICAMMCQVISRTSVFTSARLSCELDPHCWLGVLRGTCPTRRPGARFSLSPPCSTHSSSAEQRKIYSQKSCDI